MPYQIKNGIVYGSNAVSLTQAQYDALSTAEKNNGTVYYIYDVDDIYSGNVVKNVVLSASKWASDAYIITDPDITGANIVFLTYPSSISDEMYSAIQSANIRVTNQANGSITLQALGGAPSINITVTLIIQGIDMGLQTAEHVTYDNSTSGLEAVNVQEAVDELNNGLMGEFTQIGTATLNTTSQRSISLTSGHFSDFTDLLCIVDDTSARRGSFFIPVSLFVTGKVNHIAVYVADVLRVAVFGYVNDSTFSIRITSVPSDVTLTFRIYAK